MNSVHIKQSGSAHNDSKDEVLILSRIIENPKKLIFDSAKKILQEEGYGNLSIRKIAKMCDIAVGTIYNYYPNKKDIVIEMMSEYWDDYFKVIEEITVSTDSFYGKLEKIKNELGIFVKSFKEIWLKVDFYTQPGYLESGLQREYVYMDKLVRKIQLLLDDELAKNKKELQIGSYEMAKFITMNLITIIQMKSFDFKTFEAILRQLLK